MKNQRDYIRFNWDSRLLGVISRIHIRDETPSYTKQLSNMNPVEEVFPVSNVRICPTILPSTTKEKKSDGKPGVKFTFDGQIRTGFYTLPFSNRFCMFLIDINRNSKTVLQSLARVLVSA